MHDHNSPEIKLIPTVKQFCQEKFPGCVMIFHPSVFFNDKTFKDDSWDEADARIQLGTNPKTKQICEVTPDYGIFRAEDIIGIRMVIGNKVRRELPLIKPGTPQFSFLTEFCDPIPYIAWNGHVEIVPNGKVMVVVLKDKTFPVAVIDHKGGRTYNIQSQRKKALAQARRFGASVSYMLTEASLPEPVRCDGEVSASVFATYPDCTIWELKRKKLIRNRFSGGTGTRPLEPV